MTSALKKRVENKLFFTGMEERKNNTNFHYYYYFFISIAIAFGYASKPTEFVRIFLSAR